MKLTARIMVSVALLALLGTATGCNKLESHDRITKGVQAFKNADYDRAVGFFQEAIKLDPTSPMAKLYLATAYAYQVVPNLDDPATPEGAANLALAQKALDGFNSVLADNPNDLDALKQIASIDRNIQKYDSAKDTEKKVIALDPKDPEAYYTIAAIDYQTVHYKNTVPILAKDGLIDDGEGNAKVTKGACAKLQEANTDLISEAMQYLEKAIDLNPNYDDAMSYLQLAYREKANLECGNPAARKADLDQSDIWIHKQLGARKYNEEQKEKKAGGGVQM